MIQIDPKEIATSDLHQYLLGAVAPRPIAFASTIDENGVANLAPFSFFNAFSSNPPLLVFSANRRVNGNTTKDTLHNVETTGEVVINVVTYNIVRQAAVASVEFPENVSEFVKAGLTPLPSERVKPFRVQESPVQMECRVQRIISLGDGGGAGNLIVCELLLMHIDERILDEKNRINPHKIDLMGRMGRTYYVRASGESIHTIHQPYLPVCLGFDQLPGSVRNSHVLTGNNLGQLAGMVEAPERAAIESMREDAYVREALQSNKPLDELHRLAQKELAKDNTELAARIAWLGEYL